MGVYLFRTENVSIAAAGTGFAHGLGVAPAKEVGEVFIRPRTGYFVYVTGGNIGNVTVVSSDATSVTLAGLGATSVDLLVMAFHSIIK